MMFQEHTEGVQLARKRRVKRNHGWAQAPGECCCVQMESAKSRGGSNPMLGGKISDFRQKEGSKNCRVHVHGETK